MDTDVERGTTLEIKDYYGRSQSVGSLSVGSLSDRSLSVQSDPGPALVDSWLTPNEVESSVPPAQLQQVVDEHDIEKGGRANAFSGKMIRKLQQVPREYRKNYIYRVADVIRKGNESHYEPILFSIGPQHRGKSNLQSMEEHKWRYLNQMIKRVTRKKGISKSNLISRCYGVLEKSEDEARGYYADDTTSLDRGEFLEMLLLDGCFIIEILHKTLSEVGDDLLFDTKQVEVILQHDVLFLLENQLPFFILQKLYDVMVTDNQGDGLLHLAINKHVISVFQAIRPVSRAMKDAMGTATKLSGKDEDILRMGKEVYPNELRKSKHLFELIYRVLLKEDLVKVTVAGNTTLEQDMLNLAYFTTFSATELSNAGVKFKPVDKEKFYEIQFKNGILEIPTIYISRSTTEGVFRNLIAYEMGDNDSRGIINAYVSFMDSLINSGKDVELLRTHGIIEHFMGDDETVSTMFNHLGTITERTSNDYYCGVIWQLKRHCRKRRHRWMAKLRSDYFSSPWTVISVIAAFILLVLTVISTVYTPISYYNS